MGRVYSFSEIEKVLSLEEYDPELLLSQIRGLAYVNAKRARVILNLDDVDEVVSRLVEDFLENNKKGNKVDNPLFYAHSKARRLVFLQKKRSNAVNIDDSIDIEDRRVFLDSLDRKRMERVLDSRCLHPSLVGLIKFLLYNLDDEKIYVAIKSDSFLGQCLFSLLKGSEDSSSFDTNFSRKYALFCCICAKVNKFWVMPFYLSLGDLFFYSFFNLFIPNFVGNGYFFENIYRSVQIYNDFVLFLGRSLDGVYLCSRKYGIRARDIRSKVGHVRKLIRKSEEYSRRFGEKLILEARSLGFEQPIDFKFDSVFEAYKLDGLGEFDEVEEEDIGGSEQGVCGTGVSFEGV